MAKSLNEALFNVQKTMPAIQKDSVNPHFKNSYVSLDKVLEIVLPVLQENDLLLTQVPDNVGPMPSLRTDIVHVPTGETLTGNIPLVLQKDDPQGVGSALTYYKRYSILSILGLTADEDDDGQAATTPTRRVAKPSGQSQAARGSDSYDGYV